MAEPKTISHALQLPSDLSQLETKCGMRIRKNTGKRHEVAFNAAAATCVACARVVAAELEITKRDRGPVRDDFKKYWAWADGPDSGISSKTIVEVLTGARVLEDWRGGSEPLDASDFGRCYRMLKLFPELRARIGEMRSRAGWALLAEAWDELEALYEQELPTGKCPKLYRRMCELRGERSRHV